MSTYLREIEIKNFRCFDEEEAVLAIPNGAFGSGLTLLIGDNGTGKTSVLDAIDAGLGGKYRAESRITISDATVFERDIEITCKTDRYKVKAGSDYMKGKYFNSLGTKLVIKSRDRKAPGKFLSPPLSAVATHAVDEDFYYYENDIPYKTEKPVDSRDKSFSPDALGDIGLTIFYFDKNRGRHLSHGTFRTTFDAICDDLNWKFRKELSLSNAMKDYERRVTVDGFDWILEKAQPGTGSRLNEELSKFFDDGEYGHLRFDLFNLLEPFSEASFSLRKPGVLTGVTPRKLGSGIELVLALLLQKFLSDQAKTQRLYLIDEPELHLHPRAQEKLADILLEEARQSQVIISSHSPYLHRKLKKYSKINVFNSDAGRKTIKLMDKSNGLFPWSPSFGEVNWLAFGLATVDFIMSCMAILWRKKNCPG